LTGLPESVGQLQALQMINIWRCVSLKRLPFSFAFIPVSCRANHFCSLFSLSFPSEHVAGQGMQAIKAFLLAHHHLLKIMIMVMAARRRRMRRPPPELWELIHDKI